MIGVVRWLELHVCVWCHLRIKFIHFLFLPPKLSKSFGKFILNLHSKPYLITWNHTHTNGGGRFVYVHKKKLLFQWMRRRDAFKAQTNAFYYGFFSLCLDILHWNTTSITYTHTGDVCIYWQLNYVCMSACVYTWIYIYMVCYAHSVDWLPWLGVVGKVDSKTREYVKERKKWLSRKKPTANRFQLRSSSKCAHKTTICNTFFFVKYNRPIHR